MEQWKPDDSDGSFEMTSMIDVVFLLIAFFMTVASFSSAELIGIKEPKAPEAKVPEETEGRQFISITADGMYFYGAHPSNVEDIRAYLTSRNQDPAFRGVYIRADQQTPHKYVNRVMTACAEAGIFNVIFGTLQD